MTNPDRKSPSHVRSSRLALCLGAALALAGAAQAQDNTNPFYDAPDAQLTEELKAWGSMFWQFKNSGTPANTAAAFSYSNDALNSPLFAPAMAATKTVASVAAADGCVGQVDEGVITVDSALAGKISLYMTAGIIETDLYTAPVELSEHVQAIMAALATTDVHVWVENDMLMSEGLPVKPVEPLENAPGVLAYPSAETWDHILALGGAALDAAATQDLSTAPRKALTGERPLAAAFEENIVGFLRYNRNSGALTSRISARFGRFGSLPLVLVHFDDANVLIDTINGNVAGPFEQGTPLDASSLLAAHSEYQAGTSVTYINEAGCVVVAGPAWVPGLPTGPRVTTPYTPTPPRAPNMIPGNPGNWSCVSTGWMFNPTCTCTTIEVWDSGTPLPPAPPGLNITVRVRHTCVYTGGYCGTSTSFPPTPANPTPPPAATLPTIPGPVPPGTLTPPASCTAEFEVWS